MEKDGLNKEKSNKPEFSKYSTPLNFSTLAIVGFCVSLLFFVIGYALLFWEITGRLPRGGEKGYSGPGWWEMDLVFVLTFSGHFSYDRSTEILAEPAAFVGVPALLPPFAWLDGSACG